MKMTSLLIACGLALAPAACKKDKDDDGVPSAKTVEEAEKEAIEARENVAEQKEDLAEAKAEARDEIGEQRADLAEASGDFARQRDQFVAQAKSKMSQLETRLDALSADYKAGAAKLKGEAREDLDKLMREIDEQKAKARAAFDAASTGTQDRWNDLEKNTGEALDSLDDKANDVAEKLKSAGVKLRAEAAAADR